MSGLIRANRVQRSETGAISEPFSIWVKRTPLNPYQFNCTGTAVASETANLQKAIDAAATAGLPLDLLGRTWRSDGNLLIPSNLIMRRGRLNLSNMALAVAATGLTLSGSLGAAIAIAGPLAKDDVSITPANVIGISAKDKLLVLSDDVWSSTTGVTKGEWVRVKSVVGGVLNLYDALQDSYATNIRLYKPVTIDNVEFENIHLIGGGDDSQHSGINGNYICNAKFHSLSGESFPYALNSLQSVNSIEIDGGFAEFGQHSTGISYGHAVSSACRDIRINNVSGYSLRHVATAGGLSGVVRGYRCTQITGDAMTESTADAHPSVCDAYFAGIKHRGNITNTGPGIVSQAKDTTIAGYDISGGGGIGIFVQPLVDAYPSNIVIGPGKITGTSNSYAIDIENSCSQPIDSCTITGVDCITDGAGAKGIGIFAKAAGNSIKRVAINGGIVRTANRALEINAATGKPISNVAVNGGVYERTNTTAECVMLTAVNAGELPHVTITGAETSGGTYGIRGNNTTNNNVQANRMRGWATGAKLFTAADNGTTELIRNNNETA